MVMTDVTQNDATVAWHVTDDTSSTGPVAVWRIETGVAFLTGADVDPRAYRPEFHDRLAAIVSSTAVPLSPATPKARPSQRFYTVDADDHGSEVISTALLRADPAWLAERCGDVTVAGWTVADVRLDVLDFGVATAVLGWVPAEETRADIADLRTAVADLNESAPELTAGVAADVAAAVQEAFEGQELLLTPHDPLQEARAKQLPRPGEILWAWNHCRASAPDRQQAVAARALASHLCPNDFEILQHRDHTYAAGVFTSVTCSALGCEADGMTLARTTPVQDAWWTLFWMLDRVLLALLIDLGRTTADLPMSRLAAQAVAIQDIAERTRLYRSRVDSVLVSSGARDIAVWQTLAKAWDLDFRIGTVDHKLELLQASYRTVVARLNQARNTRITLMVYLFTALSLVSNAVSVEQYSEGRINGSLTIRLLILTLCVLASMAAVVLTLRVRVRTTPGPS
ncbi:MAG TPA: hypothetical protein VGP36_20535 [Mycobacteriales bacterium]|nr:hypothetical protein [Mycobacteriales bacterium]